MAPPATINEWLSAAQIAQLGLPGLPRGKRGLHALAKVQDWANRTASDGTPLARPRRAQGGGLEYHIDLLPKAARQIVAAQMDAMKPNPIADQLIVAGWEWFLRQSDLVKSKAMKRAAILNAVDIRPAGQSKTVAIQQTAKAAKVSPRAIADWISWTADVPQQHRLPFLAHGNPARSKPTKAMAEINARRERACDIARAAFKRLHPEDRRNLVRELVSSELTA